MSEVYEIVAPFNNVNDNSVVVCEYFTEDGAAVKTGQAVISIETSKATSELTSPADGMIRYIADIGDEVPTGTVLAVVGADAGSIEEYIGSLAGKQAKNDASDSGHPVQEGSAKREIAPERGRDGETEFGVFDHAVTLGEIMVREGDKVLEGGLLAKVRSSSGVEDIKAPISGYVFWNADPYEAIYPGEAAGVISGSGIRKAVYKRRGYSNGNENIKGHSYTSLRVSAAAQKLLDEKNVTAGELGLTGLVKARDVMRCFDISAEPAVIKKKEPLEHQAPGKAEKLSKAKRSEAAFLSEANKDAVLSRVSVLVPTRGIFSACAEDPYLAGRFSSIIIMETAALLKKYSHLKSVYEDGELFVYDEINIGYALSIDEGLKVPVFHKCDELSLDEIIGLKEEYIEKYIDGSLSAKDLSKGTFTISDMSQSGCFMFDPVLNLGQSAILGIGGENPSRTEYPLILAFDHRVCDGMTAAAFLNELKLRLIAHENALIPKPDQEDEEPQREAYCDYCFRDAVELEEKGHYLFKSVDKDGQEKYICSLCASGY